MDQPTCLNQWFVNKQNVRSYRNIVCANVLNSEDKIFVKNIFDDVELVSQLPQQVLSLLSDLKKNLKEKSQTDFRNYFSRKVENPALLPVNKDVVISGCWTALCEILPKQIHGGNHNAKIFRNMVNTIINSMKGEHIKLDKLIEKWDYTVCPWNCQCEDSSRKIVYNFLLWIIKNILSSIICLNFYVATTKLSADEYKLYFFWKKEWQSFYDKQVSKMIVSNIIQKHNSNYCLGKKTRKSLTMGERLKWKNFKKDIPKLYLILKKQHDYRPIVRYKNDQLTAAEKRKIKDRLYFLRLLTGKPQPRIESAYLNLYQTWIEQGKPNLFFVKTDLTNAFGSIDREKLLKMLCDKHLEFQKTEKNTQLKKKVAQLYKDFLSEFKAPLLIRAGSTIFEWKRGLVQGYKYSPALSELYYSHLDKLYLSELLEKGSTIQFFTRVVDDYLFVTDSMDHAHAFLKALSNYRNVNYDKTVVNFDHLNIQKSEEITFLGYSYNTANLQVSRASNVFSGQMCYKTAFTNAISNVYKFLENRIGQSGIPINGHIFNFHHNDEETIWGHVFTTLCLSANKFCTILAILSDAKDMANYLPLYKKRITVKLCNSMIQTLNKNASDEVKFIYCINHFRYLSWKALLLCAKDTPKCNSLVPLISDEMAKCNCVFGKWREHASRIKPDGVCEHAALREVCTRTDLRVIMKKLHVIPVGFQCYNAKSRIL